jgi:hypothetical protein
MACHQNGNVHAVSANCTGLPAAGGCVTQRVTV